jgi:hypothetical protein
VAAAAVAADSVEALVMLHLVAVDCHKGQQDRHRALASDIDAEVLRAAAAAVVVVVGVVVEHFAEVMVVTEAMSSTSVLFVEREVVALVRFENLEERDLEVADHIAEAA